MKRLACLAFATALGATLGAAHAADPTTDKTPEAKPLGGAALLKLDDGRSGRGNLIATTGIRGFSKPPSATAHALIMTIGDYQGSIPKLKGVPYDSATAVDIAHRMGVPSANIQTLKDGELTLAGMRKAFDDLEAKLGGNDQVFIYYSGHGGRQLVQEDGNERCAESLITVDGYGFIDTEMEGVLKRLSQKSQKTIVFLDACHSGGVTTRSVGAANAAFAAKSYTPPGLSCTKPTNVLTRSINQPKPPGSGGANFVYIAAARDSEISLDQPGRGGVASQAWLACMSGAAKDIDGSGGLSAEEIQACAQEGIEQKLKGAQGFLPHHVSITGNPAMVLSYAVKEVAPPATVNTVEAAPSAPAPVTAPVAATLPPTAMAQTTAPVPVSVPQASAAPAPAIMVAAPTPTLEVVAPTAPAVIAQAPVPAPVSAPATSPVPAPQPAPTVAVPIRPAAPPAPPAKPSALAALNDIYNSRDDRRLVSLTTAESILKIGRDAINFTLTSREGGYVYLLMVGSDGKTFDLLFPNQLDRNNLIEPGGSMRLPRSAWQLTAEGPPGKDTLLAIVTDSPRDFSAAGLQPSGPFSAVEAVAGKDIQLVTAGATKPADAECSSPASTRNIAIKKRCSTGYAAALLTIEEVR
jgi:hypothetical protein